MVCTRCYGLNELKNPYREDVWGKLTKRDIEDFKSIIPKEHDIDCPNKAAI